MSVDVKVYVTYVKMTLGNYMKTKIYHTVNTIPKIQLEIRRNGDHIINNNNNNNKRISIAPFLKIQ